MQKTKSKQNKTAFLNTKSKEILKKTVLTKNHIDNIERDNSRIVKSEQGEFPCILNTIRSFLLVSVTKDRKENCATAEF